MFFLWYSLKNMWCKGVEYLLQKVQLLFEMSAMFFEYDGTIYFKIESSYV